MLSKKVRVGQRVRKMGNERGSETGYKKEIEEIGEEKGVKTHLLMKAS